MQTRAVRVISILRRTNRLRTRHVVDVEHAWNSVPSAATKRETPFHADAHAILRVLSDESIWRGTINELLVHFVQSTFSVYGATVPRDRSRDLQVTLASRFQTLEIIEFIIRFRNTD